MTLSLFPAARALALLLWVVSASVVAAQPQPEIVITSPAGGETVHDNEGKVRVAVSIRGVPDDRATVIRPIVDGNAHGPDQRTPTFVLESVERGEHALHVQLVDARGEVILASQPVTFYLWRASAGFPTRRR